MKFILTILIFCLSSVPAFAANYYYSDNDLYWILEETSPDFEMLIPADRYAYYESDRFGEKRIEIVLSPNGPSLTIGSIKNYRGNVDQIRKALVEAWSYLLTDVHVANNREITTSKGLKAKFYSLQGKGEHGKDVMLRIVIFQRGRDVVHLSYALNADDYIGETRQFWLEAVNTFQWH